MYKRPEIRTLTIASGQTDSEKISVGDYTVMGVFLDAALTGATCSFKAAPRRGDTFRAVKDSDGNTVSFASNAAAAIGLSGSECDAVAPWQWIQVVSASAEGADRTIVLVLK